MRFDDFERQSRNNLEDMKNLLQWHSEFEAEKSVQPFKQTQELEKQTDILSEAKELTEKNAEYTRQLAELTLENNKSAQKQFKSSQIYSVVATIIAVLSFGIAVGTLVFGVYSSHKTEELYKIQIQNQEKIILELQQNKEVSENSINELNNILSIIKKFKVK